MENLYAIGYHGKVYFLDGHEEDIFYYHINEPRKGDVTFYTATGKYLYRPVMEELFVPEVMRDVIRPDIYWKRYEWYKYKDVDSNDMEEIFTIEKIELYIGEES